MIQRGSRALFLAILAVAFCAAPALAVPQWSPITGTERAHTVGNGPGIQWNTGGLLGNGELSYDSATQTATLTGLVDVLSYWDVADGSCPTDTAGSTCTQNFSPELDLTVEARYKDLSLELAGGDWWNVYVNFETTGAAFDLLTTDPSDGDSTMLKASFAAGWYLGDWTDGLSTKILYNVVTHEALWQQVSVSGFLEVDGSTLHSSLFGTEYFGLTLTELTDFDDLLGGGLNEIVAATIANGEPPDFTAEGNGQAYRIASGQFVIPEPSTGLLLGFGLTLMVATNRRRS